MPRRSSRMSAKRPSKRAGSHMNQECDMGNQKTPDMSLYGFADAATDFDRRHPHWHEVYDRLGQTINLTFTRIQVMDTAVEKIAYFYGRLIAEDFMEVFLS